MPGMRALPERVLRLNHCYQCAPGCTETVNTCPRDTTLHATTVWEDGSAKDVMNRIPLSIEWIPRYPQSVMPGVVRMIDQCRLPGELCFIETDDLEQIWTAIRTLQIRGAPAIGIAAAMGVAAAVQNHAARNTGEILDAVNQAAERLAQSRPTAVNLFWALKRMQKTAALLVADKQHPEHMKVRLIEEAIAIRNEDAAMCQAIGHHGATLLKDGMTVLTHCNAGALATAEWGTALAPVYTMSRAGKRIHVIADETRPLLQGARLTAWELSQAGIPVTLIVDNAAAQVMKEGRIDAVLVGADRIAANGDCANKIGTYGVALAAKAHQIPFYVLAPSSTIDLFCPSGVQIPIEQRSSNEITDAFGRKTAPDEVTTYNPAFDVTPAELITAIITERGIASPDYQQSLMG